MEDERIVALFFERSELAIRALDDKYGALCRAVALEELDECIADKKTVEDTVEAAELARIIERFLDTLSAKERVIFMRRYAFADSYAEVAERVGVSEKNVSVRLSVTRQKLRQFLIEKEVLQ